MSSIVPVLKRSTVTQGLSGAGSAILQLGDLLIHFIRKWFLGRTPRQAYTVTFKMPKVRNIAEECTACDAE